MSHENTFGDRLIQVREKKGLSQAEMARKLGISPQVLFRYEKNQNRPGYGLLKKLIEIYPDIDLNELIGEDFDENK